MKYRIAGVKGGWAVQMERSFACTTYWATIKTFKDDWVEYPDGTAINYGLNEAQELLEKLREP